jgi:hypothetical protein
MEKEGDIGKSGIGDKRAKSYMFTRGYLNM